MPASWLHRHATTLREGAVVIAIGTFLAILGPYGTFELGWPLVWLYWVGLVGLGTVLAWAIRRLLDPWLTTWPLALSVLVLSIAIAVPMTLAVLAVGVLLGIPGSLQDWWLTAFYVLIVSIGITAVSYLVERGQPATPAAAAPPPPSFHKRLPAKIAGGEIYAVEAEDHYLRIHTSRGDDLVLMRFSDALTELAPLDGLHVHRSWWVARSGVAKVVREPSRITLHLRNNKTVPVSRNNRGAIRKAGWG
jgi:hypothetical protein